MDLETEAPRRTIGSRRWGLTLIVMGTLAVAMTIASPAQATPNTAKAWGDNAFGQLGDGTHTGPEKCGPKGDEACSTVPVAVSQLSGVTALAGGPSTNNTFSLALLENHAVMAWGSGRALGAGSNEESDVPVPVCGVGTEGACPAGPFLQRVTAISAGGVHALGLLEEGGAVVAWGANPFGQLGIGSEGSSNVPVPVCAVGATSPCSEASQQLKGAIAIAAGGEHSLALLSDHTVVAWGEGSFGELGNGATKASEVPVKVSGLTEVVAIAAGYRHSLALLKDGTVKAWGENLYGTLGNGTETKSDVPVAVSGLKEVTEISAGMHHSLALLKDGTVKAWGSNEDGQLGDGTSAGPEACGASGACSKTPVAVCPGSPPGPCPTGSLSGVSAISAGGKQSLALLANGTVKAWGANGKGQLGGGTSTGPEACPGLEGSCSTSPVEVSKLFDVRGIAGGGQHSLAFGPPPVVTNLEPSAGLVSGGTTVTITGTDFTAATAVKFGSINAGFTVNSPTSITAVSPAEAAFTRDVTVTTGWGTSATTPADRFTWVSPGPPPTIRRLLPKEGPAAGGTPVTIKGTNFTGVTAVKFGSTNATSFTVNSAKSITAVSPAGTTGKVQVTVTTPNGTNASSKRARFKYV